MPAIPEWSECDDISTVRRVGIRLRLSVAATIAVTADCERGMQTSECGAAGGAHKFFGFRSRAVRHLRNLEAHLTASFGVKKTAGEASGFPPDCEFRALPRL